MRPQSGTIRLVSVVLVAMAVTAGGCTIAKISGRGSIPLLLNQPSAKVEVVKAIKVSQMRVFDYTESYDASEMLSEVFTETQADAIINVVFTVKTTPGDFFLNILTLGIANAKTIEITGQAVKTPEGLGSLLQAEEGELLSERLDKIPSSLLEGESGEALPAMLVRIPDDRGRYGYRLIRQ
jgi:hypothetical protein